MCVVAACSVHSLNNPQPLPLQACRNSVPVPRHWSQKRKYLQGKRGIEKPPFKLPEFIEATGEAAPLVHLMFGLDRQL